MEIKLAITLSNSFEESQLRPLESRLISLQIKPVVVDFVATISRQLLFDVDFEFRSFTHMPHFEIAHDSTWDHFGRAYYESRSCQCPELHCTIYSVDEIKRQVETWECQYEQNRDVCAPYIIEESYLSTMDCYFTENLLDEGLCAWIEDFKTRTVFSRNLWKADDHSCRPYKDALLYLHQLAKLSLSGHTPQTSAASQPCCRSFLLASCHQLSGDDLLGH